MVCILWRPTSDQEDEECLGGGDDAGFTLLLIVGCSDKSLGIRKPPARKIAPASRARLVRSRTRPTP